MHQLAILAKGSIVDVWECSEYASGSEYTRVLNVSLVLNILVFWIHLSQNIRIFFPWKLENIFLRKYKKIFLSRFFWEKRAETEKCARLVHNILLLLSKPNWKLIGNKSWESSFTLWICSNKGKLHKLH